MMDISVIGVGYVGLVTAACFAEMGNRVTCIDIDEGKIENLQKGIIPIYEPGLDSLVQSNYRAGRLQFSTQMADAVANARVHFIAVGTPPDEDGSADLQHVLKVADELACYMSDGHHIIVDKSTVPVGTAERVQQAIHTRLWQRRVDVPFDVVSNPEFLKEGAAINDFMRPSRVIIGSDSDYATEQMKELYAPFTRNHERTLVMAVRDAEMSKYAANAMLATKISFMNEISVLCDSLEVDVENVRLGIGSDERIGFHFIYPGCGYGGSCFPKDVKALINMAHQQQFKPALLEAVEQRNKQQKQRLFDKISEYYGNQLQGKHFAVWGLAFKPDTDDMREAPSLILIEHLLRAGATVSAYDPVASATAPHFIQEHGLALDKIKLVDDAYLALECADALVINTEWKSFRSPDFRRIANTLNHKVIFDGRNIYDPKHVNEMGVDYVAIGRRAVKPVRELAQAQTA
jgi:UDPglucose 6-dehydrogenase